MTAIKIFSVIIFLPIITVAQQRTISGKIVDVTDGLGLPGYNIIEPATTNGTITDTEGVFTITLLNSPAIILIVDCFDSRYIEFEEGVNFKTIQIGGGSKSKGYRRSQSVLRKWLRMLRRQKKKD